MSSDIVRVRPRRIPSGNRRLPRRTERRLEEVEARGLESALRVQAAGYVAHTALTQVAVLSQAEEGFVKLAPLGEGRYQAIVDSFAVVAAAEVQRWGA